MSIRVLSPDEVAAYRSVRLAALRTDPGAFCSTLAREEAFDDATWAARLAGFDGRPGVVLVDEADDRTADPAGLAERAAIVGMVGVGLLPEPGSAVLWGMWVHPDHRRAGVGDRLVAAAVDAARRLGAGRLELEVLEGNASAAALYLRTGFVDVGPGDTPGSRRMERPT